MVDATIKGRIVSYQPRRSMQAAITECQTPRAGCSIYPPSFYVMELDPNRTSLVSSNLLSEWFFVSIFLLLPSLERTRYSCISSRCPHHCQATIWMLANIVVGSQFAQCWIATQIQVESQVRSNGCSGSIATQKRIIKHLLNWLQERVRTLPLTSFATIGSLIKYYYN